MVPGLKMRRLSCLSQLALPSETGEMALMLISEYDVEQVCLEQCSLWSEDVQTYLLKERQPVSPTNSLEDLLQKI